MTPFRRGGAGKKRDTAEGPIVEALRAVGATTYQVSGAGLPDLLVRYRGRWTPLEVKTAKGKATAEQVKLGAGDVWAIVRTVDEALKAIGAVR